MNDRTDPLDTPGLPPGLIELDRELSSFRIEERASFGPELANELGREYVRMKAQRPSRGVARRMMAAGIAALFLGTMAVPPARGALVRLLTRVQVEATEVLIPTPKEVPTPVIDVEAPALGATPVPLSGGDFLSPSPRVVRLGAEPGAPSPAPITFPELQNRQEVQDLVQSLYPRELQDEGIGGTVRLLLWVDSVGAVEEAQVGATSGVAALDRAAMATPPYLQFQPALRQGTPVGSWVQFDVRFEPAPRDAEGPLAVAPVDQPAAPDVREPEFTSEWRRTGAPMGAPPVGDASEIELLREAMGADRAVEEQWGSLEGLLTGEAPSNAMPLRWRDEAVEALEEAIVRDPDNPAPFLALGRIRRRQGLRVDARRLFERGIERAEASSAVVPGIVAADLYFEHGTIVAEDWFPWLNLGQVSSMALQASRCSQATRNASPATNADAGLLIVWNYLCPVRFDELTRSQFEPLEPLKHGVRDEMMRSYYAAIEVSPGHAGANVQLLLELADAGAFEAMLSGAQRFARASNGHPHALLLAGLALHRLGRSAEARTQFGLALQQLPAEDVEALRDLRPILGKEAARGLAPVGSRERAEMERRFWAPLDPLLATPVNEREAEHLARATYALLRFGGTATDAGQVWVRYGRPNAVHTVREGAGLRTSFWDYGPGPDVTFRRPAASLRLELTSEGRAYVEELMDVFPHRYDAGRTITLPIVTQTARFRGEDPSTFAFEVHTEVPAALATGPADSLELGLYLVGPDGKRRVVTRRRIAAEVAPLHLTVAPTARSDRVILEIYHTASNQAARVEIPLPHQGPWTEEQAISDLLLVAPISPFQPEDADRTSSLVEALTSPGLAAGEQGGLVFELYNLPGRSVTYRLRAVVEDLAAGDVYGVALKPAGELEFRAAWDRTRTSRATLTEYVTADFSRLSAGAYLLRLSVELVDSGERLESSRGIDLR